MRDILRHAPRRSLAGAFATLDRMAGGGRSLPRADPPAGETLALSMSQNVQVIPAVSPLRKKRLDFEDPPDSEAPKPKRPRLSPVSGLTPCLQPLARTPCAADQDSTVLQIGPYILLEPQDGVRSYRAVHRPTETEYSCKVYPARSYPELTAPYGRLPPHSPLFQAEKSPSSPCLAPRDLLVQPGRDAIGFFLSCRLPGLGSDASSQGASLQSPFRSLTKLVSCLLLRGGGFVSWPELLCGSQEFLSCLPLPAGPQQPSACDYLALSLSLCRTTLVLENLEDSWLLSGPDDSLSDKHGCPAYVGPEILSAKNSYSGKAAAVWSLGVVLYTMLVGRYPFLDTEPATLFSKIRRGFFSIPEGLSPQARCLIRCLLRKNPSERLTARGAASEDSCTNASGERGLEQVVPDTWSQRDEEEEDDDPHG
nr:tribbles homolog 3 [Pelodiscus sinensis]|eukprot:XP_025035390.1 tribbles homolog 3 [Pelodiscus sinensis]